jgi:uncharacterized membrane protein YidH (DUF202 family)
MPDLNRQDGTTTLLRTGFSVIAVGMCAVALTIFVFGGIGPQGARSNPGWLCLIVFLMSTPFGVLLAGLGVAKWFRNRGIARRTTRGAAL